MLPFLAGAGTTLAQVRAHEWAATHLGDPAGWPCEITGALAQVIETPLPMALIVGDELAIIPNDAYRATLGSAASVGTPFADIWGEHWRTVEPFVTAALAGHGSCGEDIALELDRAGYPEAAWFTLCFTPCRTAGGAVVAIVHSLVDTTAARQASARTAVLAGELGHRLKNTMAMVHAMAQQSLRGVVERDAVEAFKDRIVALGRAHDVLLQQEWCSASVGSVVETMTALHGGAQVAFAVDGPDVALGPRAVMSLSMLLHELATNAAKYGALSVEHGLVTVSWRVDEAGARPDLVFDWRESGGPPATKSLREGFGSRLINLGLVGTRRVTTAYREDGFAASFRAPLLQLQRA